MTAPTMTEADLQTSVIDAATRLGFLHYHTHDSRRSARGFPDLVLTHPKTGALLFVELKSATGKLTTDQAAWLRALLVAASPGQREVHVWRPEHWPDRIVDVLRRNATEVVW